jgi:hypothetical protein
MICEGLRGLHAGNLRGEALSLKLFIGLSIRPRSRPISNKPIEEVGKKRPEIKSQNFSTAQLTSSAHTQAHSAA